MVVRLESRRLGCENSKCFVYLDTLDGGAAGRVVDYLIMVPKQRTSQGETGVLVVPILAGKVGLVHLYRHPVQAYSWEVPKGFLDAGETPRSAAARELLEETGLVMAAEQLQALGAVAPEPGTLDARMPIFAALEPTPGAAGAVEPDFGQKAFAFFTLAQLERMMDNGEIFDAATMAVLYRARPLIQRSGG